MSSLTVAAAALPGGVAVADASSPQHPQRLSFLSHECTCTLAALSRLAAAQQARQAALGDAATSLQRGADALRAAADAEAAGSIPDSASGVEQAARGSASALHEVGRRRRVRSASA